MQETHKSSDSLLNQKVVELNSELLMREAKHEKLKKQFEQLSSIHNKCKSQKKKVSVGTQISDEVICSYIAVYEYK